MCKIPALCGTAVLCLFLTVTTAQVTNPTTAESFQGDILPQSPEAEAMVKNTLLPVTLYSGMADVSVPVYEIKTRNLDVPISLGYNYNGFKPAEMASYVGLGWSVQGGGVITRIVKSRVDHQDPHVIGNDYDNYININYISNKQTVAQNMTLGMIDGEPDIYVFNAPGLSGKFIMMQGQAYMLPYQKIKVTGGQTGGFTLTNEKGDHYVFTTIETRHHHQLRGADYVPDHASAYYLTRIISADLTDTISYTYNPYTYNVPPVYSEVYTVTLPAGSSIVQSDAQTLTETAANGDYVLSQQLSSIQYRNTSINFGTDGTARSDIFNNDGSVYALGTISISGERTVSQKSFSLQHQYINGKLSLTEVDVTTPNSGDQGGIDPATIQRYQFQYSGTVSTTGILPSTHGIDYYGYYNGKDDNVMLFTGSDIPNSSYSPANRVPAIAYSQVNTLSSMTYPTGGYATFAYEQNQTGHYIVTGQYYNDYDTSTTTVSWPGDDPSFIGPATGGSTISINQDQYVSVTATWSPGSYTGTVATLTFYYLTGGVAAGPLNFDANGTITNTSTGAELAPGAYNYTLTVNKKGIAISPVVIYYNNKPVIDNTLGPAPGLRVKTISHYDNANSTVPSLVKQYTYSDGVGFFKSGPLVASVIQHGASCQSQTDGSQNIDMEVMTFQAGVFAPTSDLLNNQFYYQKVTETDIGPTNIGKTDYVYNCFAPDDPDVFLQQKTEYGYANGQYYPLHQTISNYQLHDLPGFQTFTAHLTDEMRPTGYYCSQIQTPDPTQPAYLLPQIFGVSHDVLPYAYKLLQNTTETSWDMNGTNPMANEVDYYYDNPDYIYPTRVKRKNSKGETQTTYFKYPLDYTLAPALRTHALDSAFTSWENNCLAGYSTCYSNLLAALQPYQPYYNNETQFASIANSYHCESDYSTQSGVVFSSRNTQLSSWINSLDSAEAADPVVWHRALYWLQANNAYSPVIEQYSTVTKSDGNEYLVDAIRNDYSILTNVAGTTVAKQTGFEKTQLTAPVLYSAFIANTDTYYAPQVAMSFNAHLDMVSQHQTNNVNYNYLWGYNHRFPVAEVMGSDTATVAGLVNQSVLDNPPDDQTLRTELNKLRTGLAGTKALVTTCTYDPLTGMTSKTDPAGRTTYFEYDAMGRLMDVKDLNGNIIKTYQYHVVN